MGWLSYTENSLFGEFSVILICELIYVLKINLMLILLFQCLLGFVLCSAREEGYMRTLQWGESLPRLRKYILTALTSFLCGVYYANEEKFVRFECRVKLSLNFHAMTTFRCVDTDPTILILLLYRPEWRTSRPGRCAPEMLCFMFMLPVSADLKICIAVTSYAHSTSVFFPPQVWIIIDRNLLAATDPLLCCKSLIRRQGYLPAFLLDHLSTLWTVHWREW
jgi:hypothetical protein